MTRRAGKAASRKARQRKVHRPVVPGPPPAPVAVPPVGTPDAREAASLTPPRRMSRPITASTASTGSSLNARERAEYHYVERDLRDIGILTAVMAVLLVVAYFAFSAMGLVG